MKFYRAHTGIALAGAVLSAHLLGLGWLAPPAQAPALRAATVRLVAEAPGPAPIPAPSPSSAAVAAAASAPRPAAPGPAADPKPVPAEWTVPVAAASDPARPEPAATAQVAQVPAPVTLRYAVTGQARGISFGGEARLDWRHDGRQYEARLELAGPLGRTRVQHSAGRLTAAGLAPQRFSDRNRGEEAAHFDAAAGRITFSGNRPDAALAPGGQDRLSLLVQLGALLADDPAAARPGHEITVQVATARDAETWHLEVLGNEELRLPGGHLTTLKLQRLPRREHDQKVELWLAPGLDHLPVRIRLSQPDGDWVEQQWSGTDRR